MREEKNTPAADVEENPALKGRYLSFWVAGQMFGVAIRDVVQIIKTQEITPIPEFPSYARGIINLRGSIIPVIDMRRRLGKDESEYDEHACIIICMVQGRSSGMLVDGVDEVTSFADEEISPVSGFSMMEPENAYLKGIGKRDDRVVLLLETERVLERLY